MTPDRAAAERYAGKGGRIYEAASKPTNPYEMTRKEFNYFQSPEKAADGSSLSPDKWAGRAEELKQEAAALRQKLQSEGHDGVIVPGNAGNPTEVASFADVPLRAEGSGTVEGMAYHAGDLRYGADTALGRMTPGRGTGHFGTGVYFVSRPSLITGPAGRPVQQIDLSSFNLFRPTDERAALNLHDALKLVNDGKAEQAKVALKKMLPVSDEAIDEAIAAAAKDAGKAGYVESASTRVMRSLGYDGVDVRHLPLLDNTQYGTVVYRESISPDIIQSGREAESAVANAQAGIARGGSAASGGAVKTFSDVDMETAWQGLRYAFEKTSRQAFETHYFNPERGWLERSLNHPYLGPYPLSYMWGKVVPEFMRFLLLRPFGMEAPLAGAAAAMKVQNALVARAAADPEGFGKFLKDNEDALYFVQLMLPGTPTDSPVNLPAWARHLSRDQLANKKTDIGKYLSDLPGDTMSHLGIGRDISSGGAALGDIVAGLTGSLDDQLAQAGTAYDQFVGTP